jgi:hypothetical protein
VDRPEDFRDKLNASVEEYVEERTEEDGEDEESVLDLELFPKIELLFICSVYARIRSGDGGPSIAGPIESSDEHAAALPTVVAFSFIFVW